MVAYGRILRYGTVLACMQACVRVRVGERASERTELRYQRPGISASHGPPADHRGGDQRVCANAHVELAGGTVAGASAR